MTKKITYAAIAPLIGGNPLGFEAAVGHPPEYVIGMDGFWANDSLYMNYLNNTRGLSVPYHKMIEDADKITNVDVVVATCPCAGLSMLNTGKSAATRGADAAQNDHMYNSTRFVLEKVQPKVLTGENAPALFGNRGKPVSDKLQVIAEEYGYSYSLYKTSTALHGIPQARHRTFYFMWKSDTVPELEWYDLPRDNLADFLKKVPTNLLHSDEIINPKLMNEARFRFVKSIESDARAAIHSVGITAQQWIDKTGRLEDYIEWCRTNGSEKDLERALHTKMKYSINKGIWDGSAHVFRDVFNAYIGRNATDGIHPTEDRSLTLREGMALMGMPNDFELVGGMRNHAKLPQNVPTCTAKSMGEQIVKYLNGELKMTQFKTLKQNNETQTIEDYESGKILQKAKAVVKLDIPTLEEFV